MAALRVANELALRGIQVNSTGIRGVWSRHGLLSRHDRLLRLEKASAERTFQLSEEQVEALERFSPEFRERHIEAHYSGYLLAVDTFFVGHLKGVGKVYLQSAIDCFSRLAWGRLYTNKMPLTAVHLLNTDVLPTFEAQGISIKAALSDNGREFCGRPDRHPYELFLQLEGIEHRKTRGKRPQSTALSNASIARCSTSTSGSKVGAPGSRPSRRCRQPSTLIWLSTTPSGLTRDTA